MIDYKLQNLLLVFLILPFFVFGQAKKRVNNDIIIWSKDYKLQWTDYRIKDSNDYGKDDVAAETVYRMDYSNRNENNNVVILEVSTVFLKKESFYDPKYINSFDTILSRKDLQHERIHFNIGEVSARKLRKDIIERLPRFKHMKKDKVISIIEKLYEKETSECNVQQALFDKETAIGTAEREAIIKNITFSNEDRVKMEQNLQLWQEKVDNELQELEDYSNTTIPIKVKEINTI